MAEPDAGRAWIHGNSPRYGDATTDFIMKNISRMMTQKNLHSVLEGVIAAMPAIPYLMKPKKTPIAAYVIGGVSFAVFGGSRRSSSPPKTRTKALTAAKDGYSKVSDKIGHLVRSAAPSPLTSRAARLANGIQNREYQTTTGLPKSDARALTVPPLTIQIELESPRTCSRSAVLLARLYSSG